MISKDRTYNSHDKGLDSINSNHLKFKHQDLFFEIHGGINTESYQSIRVMLIVRAKRITEREHIDLYNKYDLPAFIKKVAESTGYTPGYVEKGFKALIDVLELYKEELIEKQKSSNVVEVSLSNDQQKEAKKFLEQEDLLERTNSLIADAGVIGNEKDRLIMFLLYLSRMQDIPLHAVVQSKYNYLQTKVGELIPKESKLLISHLSENALFYFEENELSNRLLLVEDTGTNKKKLLPLLELQTKGILVKTVTQKDDEGKLRTIQQKVRGPICLSISTADEENFINNSVLSFILSDDSSQEQDERMMNYQRRQSAGLINFQDQQKATSLLWNIQRVLEPVKVINPFAENIILPAELKHKQITNAHYLRFIEIIAFFKQFQKEQKVDEVTGEMYVEVSIEDIEQANELLSDVLLKKCDGLNRQTRTYFERLKQHINSSKEKAFTNREISLALQVPLSSVKRYNSFLLSSRHIQTKEGSGASGYSYIIVNDSEFKELKKSVSNTLQQSIVQLKKANSGSSQPKVAQNKNGLPKAKKNSELTKVAQKSTRVAQTKTIKAI